MEPETEVCTIHILCASGSGTSTLGRALADRQGIRFFDTDDFYWKIKYSESHPVADRIALVDRALDGHERWVLSGSLCGWGDVFVPRFDLVLFVSLPPEIRMARLERREADRYGDAILPGGARYDQYRALMDWAVQYDTAGPEIRSTSGHEAWLQRLSCPVVRLEGDLSVEEKLDHVARLVPGLGR